MVLFSSSCNLYSLDSFIYWVTVSSRKARPVSLSPVASTDHWRRQWHPTPVLLPGKSHGQRSLGGCSLWGREEPDTTERLHFHFSLSSIGEGNGNPLQCSCLENPRDGGAWWAAICGVTQSRTRLKWLSSSGSSEGTSYNSKCLWDICRILTLLTKFCL